VKKEEEKKMTKKKNFPFFLLENLTALQTAMRMLKTTRMHLTKMDHRVMKRLSCHCRRHRRPSSSRPT